MHTLTRRNECHGDEETEKRDFGRHFGKLRFRDLMHLFLGEENCSRITDGGDFFPLSFTFCGLSFFREFLFLAKATEVCTINYALLTT